MRRFTSGWETNNPAFFVDEAQAVMERDEIP